MDERTVWTVVFYGWRPYRTLIIGVGFLLLLLLWETTGVLAQEPVVTISSLRGQVLVLLQGQAPVMATVGTVLRSGDIVETYPGASVVLMLSEGSELRVGQRTKLDITKLEQVVKTGARTSHIKLWHGQMRVLLSPGHQKKASSFKIKTPNAVAEVRFSHRPEIDIGYNPVTDTTTIDAYTTDVSVTSPYIIGKRQIPSGNRAVITKDKIIVSLFDSPLRQIRTSVRQLTSPSVPFSSIAKISKIPSPGTRSRLEPQVVTVHIDEQYE